MCMWKTFPSNPSGTSLHTRKVTLCLFHHDNHTHVCSATITVFYRNTRQLFFKFINMLPELIAVYKYEVMTSIIQRLRPSASKSAFDLALMVFSPWTILWGNYILLTLYVSVFLFQSRTVQSSTCIQEEIASPLVTMEMRSGWCCICNSMFIVGHCHYLSYHSLSNILLRTRIMICLIHMYIFGHTNVLFMYHCVTHVKISN